MGGGGGTFLGQQILVTGCLKCTHTKGVEHSVGRKSEVAECGVTLAVMRFKITSVRRNCERTKSLIFT